MLTLWPNSGTATELGEVGWTPEARQSSILSRQSRALYTKGVSRRPVTPKKPAAAPKPAKPRASSRPTRQGETRSPTGERVLTYNDGSTVTVRGDGTAVHRTRDGVERVGVYKDPTPRRPRTVNTDPEGFSPPKAPRAPAAPKKRRHIAARGPQRVRWSTS